MFYFPDIGTTGFLHVNEKYFLSTGKSINREKAYLNALSNNYADLHSQRKKTVSGRKLIIARSDVKPHPSRWRIRLETWDISKHQLCILQPIDRFFLPSPKDC